MSGKIDCKPEYDKCLSCYDLDCPKMQPGIVDWIVGGTITFVAIFGILAFWVFVMMECLPS